MTGRDIAQQRLGDREAYQVGIRQFRRAIGWFEVTRERLEGGDSLHSTQDQRVTDSLQASRREPLWDGGREVQTQVFPDQFTHWFSLNLATGGQAAALLFPRM